MKRDVALLRKFISDRAIRSRRVSPATVQSSVSVQRRSATPAMALLPPPGR